MGNCLVEEVFVDSDYDIPTTPEDHCCLGGVMYTYNRQAVLSDLDFQELTLEYNIATIIIIASCSIELQ